MVSLAGDEVTGGTIVIPPSVIGERLITMSGNQKSNIYVYIFTQVPEGWKTLGQYAWHGSDVSYMLGGLPIIGMFPGALVPTSNPLDPGLSEKDYWVSEFMMRMLVNFAKTGDPSVADMGVAWPAYKNPDLYYLDIGYRPLIMPGFTSVTAKVPPR
jgi:para-nitrobenzyl esterase